MSLKSWYHESSPSWLRKAFTKTRQVYRIVGRILIPPKIPKNTDGSVMLNLGCGGMTLPCFINIDATSDWHIHYVRSVTNLRPFTNNSVDLIYVSHCLEHIQHHQVQSVLAEWYRVLRPDGILRLGVPDFNQLLKVYRLSGDDVEAIQGVLMGGQTYALNAHYTSFTCESLTKRLKDVGFREVRVWNRGTNAETSISDCTDLRLSAGNVEIPISLNLEGVK